MIDLIHKRHEGDGWIVFTELANRPGDMAKRYADAVALGVWGSTKYELHGYECKISRSDVKNDLRDPTKSEAVGAYCHYWWLVIGDEKIIEGLVIPEAWGILTPTVRGGVKLLRVVRKAPRLKPKVFDHLFAVSAIRNIRKQWVDPAEHSKIVEEIHQLKHGTTRSQTPDEYDADMKIIKLEQENKRLQGYIDTFQAASGIDLSNPYTGKRIGEAVKLALELEHQMGDSFHHREVHRLSKAAEEFERCAKGTAQAAVNLRVLLGETHATTCHAVRHAGIKCSCGLEPTSDIERSLQPDVS